MHRIVSPANPVIKMLKSLQARKGRSETGLFLAEGARLAAEAADLGVWPDYLALSEAALARPAGATLADRAAQNGSKVFVTGEDLLSQIARKDNPQTVIAAYRQLPLSLDRLDPRAARIWIGLEAVRDPGNLGTIIRTADAIGAGGVILIGQTCDPFSVETVRATMGAIFAVPLARAALEEIAAWRGGLKMAGASLRATARHDATPLEPGLILLMGNEQAGLTPQAEAACDSLVRIPMRGRADSLNLAVSTAVLAYDAWRRMDYAGADR